MLDIEQLRYASIQRHCESIIQSSALSTSGEGEGRKGAIYYNDRLFDYSDLTGYSRLDLSQPSLSRADRNETFDVPVL